MGGDVEKEKKFFHSIRIVLFLLFTGLIERYAQK